MTVTQAYIDGILEGRQTLKEHGPDVIADCLATAERLCTMFDASSPVGQMARGERDFWRRQKRAC